MTKIKSPRNAFKQRQDLNLLKKKIIYFYFWPCWVFVALLTLSLVAVNGLLIVVASLVAEHRFQVHELQYLWLAGSKALELQQLSTRVHWLWLRGPRARRHQQLGCVGSRGRAQQMWHMGSAAPKYVKSSWTRDGTCVPCISRQSPIHYTTRKVLSFLFYSKNLFCPILNFLQEKIIFIPQN